MLYTNYDINSNIELMPRLTALIYFGVKMKINFKIISLFLILFFISMTFAYAANENMHVSADADIKNNEKITIKHDDFLATQTDEVLTEDQNNTDEPEKIGTDISPKTFEELRTEVYSAEEGSTLNLISNCNYNKGFDIDGVFIKKQLTINGNGMTLDGKNTGRMFVIDANNVVLKNIIFVNGKSESGVVLSRTIKLQDMGEQSTLQKVAHT